MMPSDLRPGNFVHGLDFSHPRLGIAGTGIYALTAYGLYILSEIDSRNEVAYTPILITPQWLTDLGYDFDGMMWDIAYDENECFKLSDGESGVCTIWPVVDPGYGDIRRCLSSGWMCKIDHVHQLQNLYHSLTGKELVYSPKPLSDIVKQLYNL